MIMIMSLVMIMSFLKIPVPTSMTRGPFLETPDNFAGPVSIFSSSFIYQLVVINGANLAIHFTKL